MDSCQRPPFGAFERAACLLGAFLAAKLLVLWGEGSPASPWLPIACIWQDLLVVGIFAALDRLVGGRWAIAWMLYGALAVYTAVNVPIARTLSTPLTPAMLRAARGTLVDSIAHHATAANIVRMLAVLGVAAGLPWLLRRWQWRPKLAARLIATLAAAAFVALGPTAARHAEVRGIHQNAVATLAGGLVPRVAPRRAEGQWRRSPFPAEPMDDLTRLRGVAKGRNVLIVLLESAGARYLRPYGAAEDPMPRFSALARQAILFENAYAVYPESIKGLFSVLCSMDPAFDVAPETHGKVRSPSLADVLAGAGYKTALFHSGRFMYLGMEAIVQNRGFATLEDAGDIGGVRESSFGVDEPSAVRRILAWVDALRSGENFFIVYLPVAGHHPYETPERGPFEDREEIGRYKNALHHADASVGALLDGLAGRGLLDRTVFLLAGDHGEAFHQHPGNYGHTFFLYEENVHVPFLIGAPGAVREEIRVKRTASLLDIAPTILDLIGIVAPQSFQGGSLLAPEPRMALFFTDYAQGLLGLRDGPLKAIHELDSGRTRLFDLSNDRAEARDAAEEQPERIEAYRKHLLDWSAAQKHLIQSGGPSQPSQGHR